MLFVTAFDGLYVMVLVLFLFSSLCAHNIGAFSEFILFAVSHPPLNHHIALFFNVSLSLSLAHFRFHKQNCVHATNNFIDKIALNVI